MGSVQKRQDRPGYIARWRDPNGDRRSKSFRTKTEATRFLFQVEAAKVEGNYIDPARSKMKLAEWADEFRKLRSRKRPGTIEREEVSLRTHVLPAFGHRAMGSVRRSDVQEYVDGLALTHAVSTVRREYGFLHLFFQEAVDMEPPIIARNPCRKVTLPEGEPEEQRFFSAEEVQALYEAFEPRFKVMVLIGCFAGLRIGEQVALRKSDILFGPGQLHVQYGAFEPTSGPVQFGPLKTRYSRGRVDVPLFLLEELTTHLEKYPTPNEGLAKGLVIASTKGEPLRPHNWRRRCWDRAVAAAGLEPATPHAMRHTFVSFLIDQGLSVERVAEQARHKDPGFTWRIYRHRFEGRSVAGRSESALALHDLWTSTLAAGQVGGQRGDGRTIRLIQRPVNSR
jgi:integrase